MAITKNQICTWLKSVAYDMAKRDTAECMSLFIDRKSDLSLSVCWMKDVHNCNDTDFHSVRKGYVVKVTVCKDNHRFTPITLGTTTNWDRVADFLAKELRAVAKCKKAKCQA